MCTKNPSQSKTKNSTTRDAAIQITCNSHPITRETLDGVTYYTTTRNGVEYCGYQTTSGSWFVSSRRLALGRFNAGSGKYYETLDDLAAGCKAFAALPFFISLSI